MYIFLWIFATFQTDNGALLFGRLYGTYHPFPYISPNKTIQGLAGAYILCFFSLLAFIPLGGLWLIPVLSLADVFALSFATATLAILGDLTESFIKRVAEVKDSGNILPGHGGMLDRLDSLAWVTPMIYYYSTSYLSLHN